MIYSVVLISIVIFAVAYTVYGRFIARQINLDNTRTTPAHELNDGTDFVPAKAPLLLGQHFSAIAAAGPIVGPILAGIWFGWLPAALWIILGAIFIGGVHDMLALTASLRHKAASIGEIARRYIPTRMYIFFLIFIWLALLYVIIAFTDITAQTFCAVSENTAFGPAVAASSIIYLGLAVDGDFPSSGFISSVGWSSVAVANSFLSGGYIRKAMGSFFARILLYSIHYSDVAAASATGLSGGVAALLSHHHRLDGSFVRRL
jgi:carbon starvation protein CstA